MNYNLNQTPEYSGSYVLAPGEYRASIQDAEATKSKAGTPMIKVTFTVEGSTIFDYLSLDESNEKSFNISMSKIKSILVATGCKNFNFRDIRDMADALVGELMLLIDVKKEDYNGREQDKNVVKKYFAIPGAATRPRQRNSHQEHDQIPF